jgi:hypothetical protein
MKVSVNQKGYTLSGLGAGELNVVMSLLGQLKRQCFCDCDYDKELDMYLDGATFVACIDKKERNDFHGFVDGFWNEYARLQAKKNTCKS